MSNKIPEQIIDANKACVEALLNLANTAFAGTERIAELNLGTARSLVDDSISSAKGLFDPKSPQELLGLPVSMARPAIEKAIDYSRNLAAITSQVQGEMKKLVDDQFAEVRKTLDEALEQAAKNAYPGSDGAISAIRSAIAAADSAYQNVSNAVSQVTEMTGASIAAATNATVKAAGAAARKPKKAAE